VGTLVYFERALAHGLGGKNAHGYCDPRQNGVQFDVAINSAFSLQASGIDILAGALLFSAKTKQNTCIDLAMFSSRPRICEFREPKIAPCLALSPTQ